ncbi:MAG: hypothetical protein JWO76_440 [Nocardioides sp.]|nr:hypothetical protein [Nocardioides sp.]
MGEYDVPGDGDWLDQRLRELLDQAQVQDHDGSWVEPGSPGGAPLEK